MIIIGAGPTGLALACQLIRYGIDFVIVDKRETTTPHSKAIGVQARTLEIYEQIGLAEKLLEQGEVAGKARFIVNGRVRGEANFEEMGKGLSPYPFILMVEQGRHEAILHDHINSAGRSVSWRNELKSLNQSEEGVTANIETADGVSQTIEAKFLVGCDGAKSTVRHALGLTFEGGTFERMFYVADVEIDWEFPHDGGHAFLLKDNLLVFFPMYGENQWRIVGTFPEEFTKDEGDVLYEEIEEQINQDAQLKIDITKVNWFSTYKVHTRRTSRFSLGRCFLAGDSAHIHTPAGAQGMNTGIQDGYNLAWKLAMVVRGSINKKILDTYDEERLKNADDLLKTTDWFFDLATSRNPLTAFLRMHVFPYVAGMALRSGAFRRFVFPRVSQIGINYRHALLSDHGDSYLKVRAGDRFPYFTVAGESIYDRLREPKFHVITFTDEQTGRSLERLMGDLGELVDGHQVPLLPQVVEIFGTQKPFALLLRPDNYIATVSRDTSLAPIEDYLKRCL
ncbi:MAG TPA: FAD-dependent monooxygenase [Pyrinomonadaceae bacterium]|nr:FAD-dependent monooxygenase [Pyrinomonadaceae bacterium]